MAKKMQVQGAGVSDSDKNPNNKTVPYGGASNANAKMPVKADESLDSIAERHVVELHGEPIRNNPNFKTMVQEAKEQINANREATEDM